MRRIVIIIIILLVLTLPIQCSGDICLGGSIDGGHRILSVSYPLSVYSKCEILSFDESSALYSVGVYYPGDLLEIGILAGDYHPGNRGPDLGYWLVFHSYLKIQRGPLGLSLSHISNAGLGERNQGTNFIRIHFGF